MANVELEASWARTMRCLAASRYYLAEHLPVGEAQSLELELAAYLHHNEFGLALECAEALGQLVRAPQRYWLELKLAAENMGLFAQAERYAKHAAA